MKLQKLSDEVKAETKYCPFRLYNKETKIEAHEEMVSKDVYCYLNIIFLILL